MSYCISTPLELGLDTDKKEARGNEPLFKHLR